MVDNESAIERVKSSLSTVVDGDSIIAVYLYGSYARNEQTPVSDLDLAVLYTTNMSNKKMNENVNHLVQVLSKDIGVEVDVRTLNSMSLEFRYQVVSEGIVMYSNDDATRIAFETRTIMEYLDFRPMIDIYNQYMYHRIEGTGRI